MNIQITDRTEQGVSRTLQITIPVEEVAAAEASSAKRYASKARIPGFRPGKAPPAVIKKKFGDVIRSEALDSLVNSAFKELVEQEQLNVAGQPRVHDLKFEEGAPLSFALQFEVAPVLNLERLTDFQIDRPTTVVDDVAVNEQLDHMRDEKATWTPVTGRAELGDMVKVELATSEADGQMPEGNEYSLTLGTGQAIPGIEELILETEVGGSLERPVRWPDDFPDEVQRGSTKMVRVKLLEAKRKQLPELDDSFAREVGDFDNVDELRAAVTRDLEGHVERTANAEVRTKLVEAIIEANPFDVPAAWVGQIVRQFADSYQIPETELEKFAEQFWPLGERQVKRDLVVAEIARKESLAATEADMDARISEVAARRNADPGQVYASLQKGGRMKELENGITEDKVFAWLLERNTITQQQ